jgi:tetratricopeptide (TPR) repeat protein
MAPQRKARQAAREPMEETMMTERAAKSWKDWNRTVIALAIGTGLWAVAGCGDVPGEGSTPGGVGVGLAAKPAASTDGQAARATFAVDRSGPVEGVIIRAEVPPEVSYGDAEAVFRKGRYREAEELFTAYTRRRPENGFGHYMLGLSAWKAGDRSVASDALARAVELDPDNLKAKLNLGRVLLEENRAADALPYLESAVGMAPESAEAYRVLGNVRSDLGQIEPAVMAYRHALVLDAEDSWSMNNLGLLLIRQGRFDEALPALARATQLKPGSATFQNNLGIALEAKSYYSEAAEAFRTALETSPSHDRATISLARIAGRETPDDLMPLNLSGLAALFVDEIGIWSIDVPVDSVAPRGHGSN